MDMKTLIGKAKKPKAETKAKPKKKLNKLDVRPGTVAICKELLGCTLPTAVVFHALLELWVEAKKKVMRLHEGEQTPFLWLTGDDIVTLTGRDKKNLQNRDIAQLRKKPFVLIEKGRLTPDHPNGYLISIDIKELWEVYMLFLDGPVTETVEYVDGSKMATKKVDRAQLPHLFKRLYDDFVHENGEFMP